MEFKHGQVCYSRSPKGIVIKNPACGWAVVPMDLDGGLTPLHDVGGLMPVILL